MITVFTPSFADESNTNAQNLTVKEVVARLDPSRFQVTMLGAGAPDPRIANRANTEIIPWGKRANTVRVSLRLLRHIPDVYFFPREGPLDAAVLRLRSRLGWRTALVTYVVSGGLDEDSDRPLLFRAARECDALAANSRWMTETVCKLFGVHDVHTVYDGIDRRYYYAPSEREYSLRHKRVLFAGSFRRYKRADLVIAQAAKFREWEFRLAGTGEEETACRKLASDLNCENVRFLGHLDAGRLGEEMRQAQLFFFPSEIEGHPQVLGQAAACGLPGIARSSYHPDYIEDGKSGLLADSDADLGVALEKLIGNAELRGRMSTAAIEHAAKFDWDHVTKQWAAIMEEASVARHNHRSKRWL
jgi:glycosyltransferase involved in cell wall biosynthesis